MSAFVRIADQNAWVAAASETREAPVPCPNCGKKQHTQPELSRDYTNEIVAWYWLCSCGHKITIIND